jgi:hypothetical protein
MKKITVVITLMFSVLFLGGCQIKQNTSDPVVIKTGMIQAKSGDYYIFNSSGNLTNITSTKYNLENYLKKNIEITGEFSGDTLYVNKIEE